LRVAGGVARIQELKHMETGLLLARIVIGALMAAHGAQKLFGWFGGYGIAGTGGFFEGIGFRPGRLFATAAGVTEFGSGLLLALGLFAPFAAAAMLSVMIVAAGSVHWEHGLFASSNGIEVPLLYGVIAASLALTGPGAYSLDAVLGLAPFWTAGVVVAALALGVLAGIGNLAARKTAPVTAAA
jgi:putative oxidoreductase